MMPMLDGEVAEAGAGHAVEGRPTQRVAYGAAQGAAAEILASTHEGTLLLRALASPAAETMIRIPGKAADRVASVLCGALRRVVDSQLAYVKKPTAAGRVEAAMAHRWLWVLPTLLLRVPPSTEAADENAKTAGARKRESFVIDRVKLIEADHAIDLLETYVAEMENPTANRDQNMLPAWTDAQQKNYTRAVRKAVDGGLKQAKVALESGPEVPRDESTMLELCRLVAVDVDDTERRAQTLAAMRARALHAACPTLRMKHLRSRVWRLKSVASPGPSGWRNTHVQAVARMRGGMQLLMQWVMLWPRQRQTLLKRGRPPLCILWTLEMHERHLESQPDANFAPLLARRHS